MDILQDPTTGDAVFNNDTPQVTTLLNNDLLQRLNIRLKTFLGEWFLDITFGMDWYGSVLGKVRSIKAIDAVIQEQIYLEPDVASITSYTSSINAAARIYSANWVLTTTYGTTVSGSTSI